MRLMNWNATSWNKVRYTAYAPIYDLLAAPFERSRRRAIECLQLQPGERVLIVGCGTGLDLPLLPLPIYPIATDVTRAMVHRTQRHTQDVHRSAAVVAMNGQQLALPSASIDVVVLHLILAVIPDPVRCAREVARVLRPGGRISIMDKFAADDAAISPVRQMIGHIADFVFSDVNRKLGPILAAAGLQSYYDEPTLLGGTYRIVLARHANR